MKNKGFVLLAVCTLISACNAKSPETHDAPQSAAQGAVGEPEKVVAEAEGAAEPAAAQVKPAGLPGLSGPQTVALDLLANRPNAHRVEVGQGGLKTVVVDAGAVDFVRYIHGNHAGDWRTSVDIEGKRAALLNKKRTGKMWLPGFADAPEIQLEVWSGTDTNSLKLVVNGQALEPQKLVKGWQTVTVPAASSVKAENTVEFDFSNMARVEGNLAGGAVSWVRVGKGAELAPANDVASGQGAFTLTAARAASYLVWGLPDAKLRFEAKTGDGCGFEVQTEIEDGQGGTKRAQTDAIQAVEGVATSFVGLDALKGQVGRVTLVPAEGCEVEFSVLDVVVPGETPAVPEVEAPKYVVFWLIDTLRADHLPIHHDTNVRAPNLKRLADEGASFKVAYVQGNESKTSHASLFSAMMPSKHRVIGKGKLAPELVLMPEAMKSGGYKTAGFIANGYVSEPWGFGQGWDAYRNHIRDELSIDGVSMAKTGLEWATKNSSSPFFLYIGTSDPHVTYREHSEFIGNYETEPYNGRFKRACYGEDLADIKTGKLKVSERDKTRIHNLYRNEVEFNDSAFGMLRKGFEELGIWDQTMVIVTADHGDEFWEHGGVGHGHSLYHHQTHVPLIFYYPPLFPAGTVVEAGADVFDVYPTMVEAIGQERPKNLQGKSLLPLVHKVTGDYPEPAVATQYLLHYASQMQHWKLYLRRGEYQLYDRSKDHDEQNDVSSSHPLASRWLLDSMGWMRAYRADWDKAEFGATSNLRPGFIEKIVTKKGG